MGVIANMYRWLESVHKIANVLWQVIYLLATHIKFTEFFLCRLKVNYVIMILYDIDMNLKNIALQICV